MNKQERKKIIDFVTVNVEGDRGSLFLNDEETNELYSRVA